MNVWHHEGTAVLAHHARGTGPVSPGERSDLPGLHALAALSALTPAGSKRPSPSPNTR